MWAYKSVPPFQGHSTFTWDFGTSIGKPRPSHDIELRDHFAGRDALRGLWPLGVKACDRFSKASCGRLLSLDRGKHKTAGIALSSLNQRAPALFTSVARASNTARC